MLAMGLERQEEPVDSNHDTPLDFILRTKESSEGLFSNILRRSYLDISSVTVASMHKMIGLGKCKSEKKENRFFLQ